MIEKKEIDMKAKVFFGKLCEFTKRNMSAMAVSFCMILALSLVTAVAVTRMNKKTENVYVEEVVQTTTPEEKNEPVVPTAAEAIEFAMPVDGATEGLPFAIDRLVNYKTLGTERSHFFHGALSS